MLFRSKTDEDEMGGSPSEDGVPPVPSHGRTDGNGNPDDEEDLLQVTQEWLMFGS